MKHSISVALIALLAVPVLNAQDAPKDQKDKVSYGIGLSMGSKMKKDGVDLNPQMISKGLMDGFSGAKPLMTEEEIQQSMTAFQTDMQAKMAQKQKDASEKNKKEGEAFLAANKTKPGVKTYAVSLPGGATAELQYKVITEGMGATPKSNDTVQVNYRGTLINGKEFDSSTTHGNKPAKFPVNRVVRGWTEALQLMKVGSKWEVYLPSSLAYGDNGSGAVIEPGSTLVFEMELAGIEAPPAPAATAPRAAPAVPAAPLTSDVIKVPSAEELKKGAKIEVIKAEDLEKMTNGAAPKPAQK